MTGWHLSRGWWALVAGAMLLVFALDRSTGAAPVQHLYYVPIVFAAVSFGRWAGPGAAIVAVVLYHVANPTLLRTRYSEPDLVQIVLFLASGAVASRFAHDARRLRRLAETDDLTGLYNLRGFDTRLAGALRTARQTGTSMAVFVLDIDRLKSLNDTHGHRAGADAVRVVGRVLATRLPPRGISCRFGGDEFVVALPGFDARQAAEAADAIRTAVQACAPYLADMPFPVATLSISIGLACLSDDRGTGAGRWPATDADTAELLFKSADQALYAAKNAGRNRVTIAERLLPSREAR